MPSRSPDTSVFPPKRLLGRALVWLTFGASLGAAACGGKAVHVLGEDGTGGVGAASAGGTASGTGGEGNVGTGGTAGTTATGGSAGAANIAWSTEFGSTGDDWLYAVDVDPSGNLYVAGTTSEAMPGHTSLGSWDVFVRKYDTAKNELWTVQFGTYTMDVPYAMTVDKNGNVYLAGYTYETLPGQVNLGLMDAFLAKYDTNGNELWTRQFGSNKVDQAQAVSVDGAGNVYVGGRTAGIFPFQITMGGTDAFVAKYDANGNELWTRQFGTSDFDAVSTVAADVNGQLFVTGNLQDPPIGQPITGQPYLRKYDADGTELWTVDFGQGIADAWAAATDAVGNVYVGGRTSGSLSDLTHAGGTDAFMRKYDPSGTELWTSQFGTAGDEEIRSINVGPDGTVYAAGRTADTLPGLTSAGGYDAFVREYDPSGYERFTWQFGTDVDDVVHAVCASTQGSAYVAGYTLGALPGRVNLGKTDAFVAEVAQ